MARRRITLVAHTHWDREWYEPFEVFRAHLVEMLDEALAELERDPRLCFTLDGHVALVDDYLEVRPKSEPRLRALVEARRLHIGPFYTQADTLLTDGESLIRNLAAGIRRAEQLGGAMRVGYMPDQFGHAAQVPQILRLFGIDGAVLWRGVGPDRPPHAFRWVAPDGSAVTTVWLADGYGSGRRLPSEPEAFADALDRTLARLGDWLGELPVLIPVGDDHVRLASWLPAAAEAVRARLPGVEVAIGGYHDHLPKLDGITHRVVGELRSPVFAPVLAGVASARVREKQAAARAASLLQRYAEPLVAWLAVTGAPAEPLRDIVDLIGRAWRQLLLNHAHDSVAGCGIDAAHEDVRARYRWAEQLGRAAIDRALARIALPGIGIFHPGPSGATTIAEVHVPRSLGSELVAVAGDGIARPVQPLGVEEGRPLFEGEFAASELSQYLGGLDPATPIFGRYLTGIAIHDESGGVVRLDVGLGPSPVQPSVLAADQRRVTALLRTVERFRVVLHAAQATRPVLVQVGPAPANGFLSLSVQPGWSPTKPSVGRRGERVIFSGPLSVEAAADGTVLIRDERLPGAPVRANDLVDEGDRGDLYHCEPVAPPRRACASSVLVTEEGPLRARMVVEQQLDLPVALDAARAGRSQTTMRLGVSTEITLLAGERRVELVTTLDNAVCDHRLRALAHLPFAPERLDVEHGLAVVERPLDPASALGHGTERAAPTGQHHGFVDATGGGAGVALFSPGLPEHEIVLGTDGPALALTLVRAVGWLSRGDLSVIAHAAGPIVPTPGAQEPGPHRFAYALLLHAGDWEQAGLVAEARRFAAPPIAFSPTGATPVSAGRALVEVEPATVTLTALKPADEGAGVIVRLLNASSRSARALLRPAWPLVEARAVDPLEQPLDGDRCVLREGLVELELRPWQIATVLLR